MKYGSFKKKILILNKIINIIYKIRFILIAIFLASTTTVVTLKSVKGTNSSFVQRAANEIVYGEDYNFLPESIMNAAHVEYKEINETEWTEVKPAYAGTYEARAYSYNGWDAKVIGETFKFTIKPKEIHLYSLQKELVYGEKLNYGSSSLINGDYFKNIQYDFADNYYTENPFDTKDTFNTTIDFNIETIKVLNNEDVDVTRNYSFINDQTPITIKKRVLSLKTDSLSLSYDGNPHTNTNFSFDDRTPLAEGDRIEVISSTEIKEVGETENKLGIKILDSSNRNRTAFYNISFDYGSLAIKKREITLQTSSLNKVYDGKPFDESDFSINITSGSLLENHEIEVTYDHFYDFKPLIDNEEAKVNSVNFKIIDKDTLEDVTDRYYDYQVKPGEFTISKREITIRAASEEKIYDSKILEGSFILEGEIPETDQLIYKNKPSSIIEVGSEPYSPSINIERKETSKDVTNCYQIAIQEGELKIVKRNLILSSNSINREYNGKAISAEDLSVDYTSAGDGLSENHKISFEFDNIGQYFIPNGLKNDYTYKIQDKEGNEIDINKYYNVIKEVGDLKISKKEFKLETPVIDNVYSGSEYQNDEFSQVGLVEETDSINFTKSEIKETNVGVYENSREYTIYNSVLDKDVTECYDITNNFGKFNINKNTITIKTEDYDGIYSGKELDTELVYSYETSNPVSPDIEVNISLTYQNVNVATFIDKPNLKNEATYTIIKDGVDVSDNFNIIEDFGDLHVEKAALRFTSPSLETTYDGAMHSNSDYDVEGLQGNDIVSLISIPEFNHANTYENKLEFNIYSDASETYNVTNCYEITTDYKDIVINKRNLTLDFTDTAFSCTYDGYSHTFSKNEYKISGDLASGDNLIINQKPGTNIDFVEAGSYSFLSYYDISIFNDNGEDTTDDYNITPIYTTSIIEKQKLKIKIKDYFNTYDGDFHSAEDSGYTIKEGTIAVNDKININSDSYRDAMDEESVFNTTINIKNLNLNKDVTSSYDLEIEDGRVKIDKKTINVYLNNSSSKEYDGNDTIQLKFSCDASFDFSTHRLYYPTVHTGNSNVCSNELISVDASKFTVFDSATNKDVTNNYSFNLIGEARYSIYSKYLKIYIKPESCTFIYDGNEHYITDKDLSYNGTLAKDDKITLVDYTPIVVKEVSDSGKDVVQIVTSNIKIIGKDGSDNTSNYGIEILTKVDKYTIYAGELSLSSNPLPLTKTFDNKPFDKSLFKVSITNGYSLPLNEKIDPTFYNINVKDVGRYENSFSVKIIDTDTDTDVSSNYSISSLTFGELIINPLTFSISSLQNDSISYNGENYITDLIQEYEVSGSTRYVTIKNVNSDLFKIENIRIVAVFNETIPETRDAGEYSFSYAIRIYIDDVDVTNSGNFSFYSTNSYNVTFSIKKISLKFYNYGGEHSLGDVDETLELGGSVNDFLKTGDTIYFGDEEFDEAKSDYLALDMSSPGTYTYEDLRYFFDTIRIVNKNGEDVTHNYEIDFSQIDDYEII